MINLTYANTALGRRRVPRRRWGLCRAVPCKGLCPRAGGRDARGRARHPSPPEKVVLAAPNSFINQLCGGGSRAFPFPYLCSEGGREDDFFPPPPRFLIISQRFGVAACSPEFLGWSERFPPLLPLGCSVPGTSPGDGSGGGGQRRGRFAPTHHSHAGRDSPSLVGGTGHRQRQLPFFQPKHRSWEPAAANSREGLRRNPSGGAAQGQDAAVRAGEAAGAPSAPLKVAVVTLMGGLHG